MTVERARPRGRRSVSAVLSVSAALAAVLTTSTPARAYVSVYPGMAVRGGAGTVNPGSPLGVRSDGAIPYRVLMGKSEGEVAKGTNVATADVAGYGVFAFHAVAKNELVIFEGATTQRVFTGFSIVGGVSPAVAAVPTGGYAVAFQRADDGLLWARAPNGTFFMPGAGYGLAPKTNPAITGVPGGYVIAFQGGDGNLWYVDQFNHGNRTDYHVAAGTSPAIADVGNGFAIAFRRAEDGLLWIRAPNGMFYSAGAGFGIEPGTSPDIVQRFFGSFVVAFHGATVHTVYYIDENNIGHNTSQPIAPGASPALATDTHAYWQIAYPDPTLMVKIFDLDQSVFTTIPIDPGDGIDFARPIQVHSGGCGV